MTLCHIGFYPTDFDLLFNFFSFHDFLASSSFIFDYNYMTILGIASLRLVCIRIMKSFFLSLMRMQWCNNYYNECDLAYKYESLPKLVQANAKAWVNTLLKFKIEW